MIIRKAKTGDESAIELIANSIKLKDKGPNNKGFLVYILNKEDYQKRIQLSDYFYVAELDNKIIGFLMCYDDETLTHLKNMKLIRHEDSIANYLISQNKPFVFGDQIGVLYDYSNKDVGSSLIKHLIEDMKKDDINKLYVAILHKPFKNKASLDFCKKLGFRFIEEVENDDKKVWGICLLNINN
jgi:GNAT superfamily N-acetyltransferase